MEGFTFYGGGKGGGGGDMPEAPDYEALARQQAEQQQMLNRNTTQANRPNQYTPWGSIEWFQEGGGGNSPSFDQAGYDAFRAQQGYGTTQGDTSGMRSSVVNGPGNDYDQFRQDATNRGMWLPTQGNAGAQTPQMSDEQMRAMFTSSGGKGDPDKWSSRMTLNPELQKILDNEFATKQQGYSELRRYLGNINDSSRIPGAVVNPGQTAQQAIMARLDPTFNTDEESLRTRLMNQGVRAGSEAWDNEFRNFGNRKNDAYSQAALQGIGLDNQARATALAEQGMPLNAIQSFLSGGQVQAPQFGGFSNQANASAPDLMGAAQGTYGANMNGYNAQQAQGGNFMSGLFGLGGAMLGGPMGGALGAALGGGFGGGGTSIPINFGV